MVEPAIKKKIEFNAKNFNAQNANEQNTTKENKQDLEKDFENSIDFKMNF